MGSITRRTFVLSTVALPIGCALGPGAAPPLGTPEHPTSAVREPVVGQRWRYAKHDLFTRSVVDTQIDEVVTVSEQGIEISSSAEGDQQNAAAPGFLRRYFGARSAARRLPSEIQARWGAVVVDPHWGLVQIFDSPLPLWPTELRPGWDGHFSTTYRTGDQDKLPWQQTMKSEAWESITVPAGQFQALKYLNLIHFESNDLSRANSIRREKIWFAPEIGRWVARESQGTYYFDESTADGQYQEAGYRWELLSWT